MWKKIGIAILSLLGTFSVVYALNQEISAAGNVCSNVSGRFGSLEDGDIIQTSNSEFRIISDYNGTAQKDTSKKYKLGLSNHSLGTVKYGGSGNSTTVDDAKYSTSNVKALIDGVAAGFSTSDKMIIGSHKKIPTSYGTGAVLANDWYYDVLDTDIEFAFPLYAFDGSSNADIPGMNHGITYPELAFQEEWWTGFKIWTNEEFCQMYMDPNGKVIFNGTIGAPGNNDPRGVRAGTLIDYNNIPFSVNDQSNAGCDTFEIEEPSYTAGAKMTTAKGDPMRVRYVDTSRSVDFEKTTKTNTVSDPSINTYAENSTFFIHYKNANPNGRISLAVVDSKNEFILYQVLGTSASGSAEIDASKWAVGTYSLYLYNEEISAGTGPLATSQTVLAQQIHIVSSHSISYTKAPQTGATLGDYEYSKNVNGGQKIGSISLNPTGVLPITYEIASYDGTDTSFENFEISGLDAIGSSSATSLDVKIKPASNLTAQDYKFCIIARDANGDPQTPVDGKTKVCTSFTVEKTQPTIAFTSDDKGTIYVKGDVANTITHSESATHSNGDASSNDVGIVYSTLSDPSSIIQSGLPFTSAKAKDVADIVFKANVSGTVEMQALIPESDNYKEAKTKKKIIVQLGLTGNYVEDEVNITAGSTAAKPPASYSQANRIGHINVSGGTSPFSYSLPAAKGNNGSFHIDTNGNIYVNQSVTNGLTPGNYDIEVDITDTTSPKKQTANVKKTIKILPATLSGVAWLDPATGKALSGNTITVTYDPSKNGGSFNTKLLETTAGSLANTGITFTLDPSSNDAISITPSGNEVTVTVKKASDATTKDKVKVIASITGGMYGSTPVTTEVYVNVEKYTQTIAFSDTTKLKLPAGSGCVSVPASITSTYSIPNGVIQYSSTDTSANAPFAINADGKVCPTSHAGTASLIGTLLGNDNFTDATTPVSRVIEVYEPGAIEVSGSIQAVTGASGVNYTAGTLLKAHDSTKNPNGTAKVDEQAARVEDTGSSTPSYAPSTNKGNKNADISLFNVMPKGSITLKQDMTASDIQNHGTGNIYYIQVDVTDDNGYTKTVDVEIKIADADADFYFIHPISGAKLPLDHVYDDGKTKIAYYTTDYVPNGTIDIKTNLGSTYSEDTVGDTDVIDALNKGSFTILNASDPTPIYGGLGGNTYVKACMSKKTGYSEQCIYAQVEITKAEQPDFAFVQSPTWTLGKTPASITPIYNDQLSTGDVIIQSIDDTTIAEIESPVPGSNQSFKTTGKVGTTTITATAPADRNYNSKEAETTLNITEKPPTTLSVFVPSMTYGDTGSQAQITNGYKPGVPAYFYVDDTSILTVDGNPVNAKDSPAFTANGSGQVTVKVCQTSDPFDPATDDCNAIGGDYGELTITVKKKPLTLTYEDEEIYTGEDFPAYRFIIPPQSSFVGGDSIHGFPIPANTSAKEQGTALADTKTAGTYAISGSYTTGELTGNALHYEVTIQDGELTIKQDTVLDSWYHLEDPQGNTVNKNEWHNYFVDVVLDTAKGDGGIYDQISNTNTFTNADKTRFTVNEEDENLEDVYFRIDPNGSEAHKGSITSTQTTIKLDMTAPEITSITGYPVNTDGLSNLLHEITLGHFFKPGVEVTIQAIDPQPANTPKVKVSGIDEVEYKVYALDDKGIQTSQTAVDSGSGVTDINGNMSFKINKVGNYRVCATTTDYASNPAIEKCADLNIHKIDVDEDGDGEPDFNDSDNDGCPDLNIVLGTDKDGNKIKLNVAEKGKKYPYMNIDSNGDGKPDLNIDTDNDGRPDLNLVDLSKEAPEGGLSAWVPNICVNKEQLTDYTQSNKYCTGTKAKPLINVVVDNGKEDIKNQIPSINIDTDGDFKADMNISKDGKKPYLNIATMESWKPVVDYSVDDFLYDTIKPHTSYLNYDSDNDGYPDINIDLDGDGIADLNIDVDGDKIPDVDIDSDGDGKPDINIDGNNDGIPDENIYPITTWKPDKQVDNDMPYDTMIIERIKQLEKDEVIVEYVNTDEFFLPNYALKVQDVSNTLKEKIEKEVLKDTAGRQVASVYNVALYQDDTEIKPNGKMKIRFPLINGLKNASLLIETEDGQFKTIIPTIENGYYVYESDMLGIVSILGDVEDVVEPDTPLPDKLPDEQSGGAMKEEPATSVKGAYTQAGASTGDTTRTTGYLISTILSICFLCVWKRKHRNVKK